MNKNAIKKFAINARNKLIASVTDRAGMLGITADGVSSPVSTGKDFEVYKTAAGTEVTLSRRQCEQRRRLASQIESRSFEAVIEEIAYTWFNRICAIRFMEVNDYLPVRVLSSVKQGKTEPDLVTQAPDVDMEFTDKERDFIVEAKLQNRSDELFRMLFIKQCHELNAVLPKLFENTEDYTEMLLSVSYTNKDDVVRMLVDTVDEKDFNVTTPDENEGAASPKANNNAATDLSGPAQPGVTIPNNPTGQVEIIGWLYQYYNTELKDDTFAKLKKNIKITKERIPAATQLFTPDWIVLYMVENSVGRLWIEHLRAINPDTDEKKTAEGFGWKYYLPEAKQEESVNIELARIRASTADLKPEEILCVDPCMGSGHILIAMFDVLMDIYKSTGYSEREAAFAIVENNIQGIDIDKRAYQLAYFAVMMKGRGYNRRFLRGRDGQIPQPKVYAIQESNGVNRGLLKYFGAGMDKGKRDKATKQIEGLIDTFRDAMEYGAILNVENYDWELLQAFIKEDNSPSQLTLETIGIEQTRSILKQLIEIGKVMTQKYHAVVTNPPYMGTSSMGSKLSKYVKDYYPNSKTDMYTVFIEKCLAFCKMGCMVSMIAQQSWMFFVSFEKFRGDLKNVTIQNMIHLGARSFDEISGEVVQTTAFSIKKIKMDDYMGVYQRLVDGNSEKDKIRIFLSGENQFKSKSSLFSNIKGSPIAYWVSNEMFNVFKNNKLLGDYLDARNGMSTTDNNRFLRLWYEININKIGFNCNNSQEATDSKKKWFPYNKGGETRKWYGNNSYVVNWENDGKEMKSHVAAHYGSYSKEIRSEDRYFQESITWNGISASMPCFRYSQPGAIFDSCGSSMFACNANIYYTLGFLNTIVASKILEISSPSLSFNAGAMESIPYIFDESKEGKVEKIASLCVEISKQDWDSYETSWGFRKHPLCISGEKLISRSYKVWENKINDRINMLLKIEQELNDLFVSIYGLENELKYTVARSAITIKTADVGRDIRSLISYSVGCMFGRYSIDTDGLAYAGGKWESNKFILFVPDADNVIPITDEEYFKDDIVGLFCAWLKKVYGAETLEENLDFIAKALGNSGSSSREVIRNYFLNDFFKDHCSTYSVTGSGKRPIYWLFDSGKANGFKCLIYLHRYTPDTVGIIRTEYLHKTQKAIEQAMVTAERIRDNSTKGIEKSAATKKIAKYTKQLAEIQQYDEAMAHIAGQRIDLDLDDGVKVNYAKFQGVEVAHEGKKNVKINLLAKI